MAMGKEMYRSASYWHHDDSMFATDGKEYSHCTHRDTYTHTDTMSTTQEEGKSELPLHGHGHGHVR